MAKLSKEVIDLIKGSDRKDPNTTYVETSEGLLELTGGANAEAALYSSRIPGDVSVTILDLKGNYPEVFKRPVAVDANYGEMEYGQIEYPPYNSQRAHALADEVVQDMSNGVTPSQAENIASKLMDLGSPGHFQTGAAPASKQR